jgi:hypothetical protein
MGFEYKIKFEASQPEEFERFFERLRTELSSSGNGDDFTVSLEPDGIYFCDYIKSEHSSCAFRSLIDLALAYSEVVRIVEP